MPNRPITITGINPDNSLILSDHGHTSANPGDTITWLIAQKSGVTAINSILPKAGSPNIFKPAPGPVGHSSNWRGTIDPSIHAPVEEDYSIGYSKIIGGDFVFDPKISVNSKKYFFKKKFIFFLFTLLGLSLSRVLLHRNKK